MDFSEKYLDILKKSLTGSLDVYFEEDWCNDYKNLLKKTHYKRVPPGSVLTMVGQNRLAAVQKIIFQLIRDKVPGDFLIAGCWRGGLAIFCKACLDVYEPGSSRKIWCADVFAGQHLTSINLFFGKIFISLLKKFPLDVKKKIINRFYLKMGFPSGLKSDEDIHRTLKVVENMPWWPRPVGNVSGISEISEGFKRYHLFDDNVKLLKGWFSKTLPSANISSLAFLYADADMYESTQDILKNVYHKIVKGGYFVADDYGSFFDCKRAIDEFRQENNLTQEIRFIDEEACYWVV